MGSPPRRESGDFKPLRSRMRERGFAINAKYGQGHALPCSADIGDRESLRKLVERTRAQ